MGHKPDQRARRKRREREAKKAKTATKPDQVDRWLVHALEEVGAACERRERSVEVELCDIESSADKNDARLKAAEETAKCLRADEALRANVERVRGTGRGGRDKLRLCIRW